MPSMRSCGRPVTPDPTRHPERRAQLTRGITDTPPTSTRSLGDALAPPTRPPPDGDNHTSDVASAAARLALLIRPVAGAEKQREAANPRDDVAPGS